MVVDLSDCIYELTRLLTEEYKLCTIYYVKYDCKLEMLMNRLDHCSGKFSLTNIDLLRQLIGLDLEKIKKDYEDSIHDY